MVMPNKMIVEARVHEPSTVIGRVFQVMRNSPRGATIDDVRVRLPRDDASSISSAVVALAQKKMLVWDGEFKDTRRGRPAKVWLRRK